MKPILWQDSLSSRTAPPGHATFTVLRAVDGVGFTATIKVDYYPDLVRETKSAISERDRVEVFNSALGTMRQRLVDVNRLEPADIDFVYALVAMLIKDPDKSRGKTALAAIDATIEHDGDVHLLLLLPPSGAGMWAVCPSGEPDPWLML